MNDNARATADRDALLDTFVAELTRAAYHVALATLARGRDDPDKLAQARRRASMTCLCVVGFVCGCAAGAVLEVYFGLWALVLPVILAALPVPLGELRSDGEASLECKNGGSYDDQPTCAQASQN